MIVLRLAIFTLVISLDAWFLELILNSKKK